MRLLVLVASVAALMSIVPTCDAETVELKTGQRIDRVVKSVTETEVLLDVAGQSVAFPREKVAAIYFAAPPKAGAGNPLNDALRVLKGLQSATTAGVNYRDYAPRVTDAKIQVDQILGDVPDGPIKTALAEAVGFYVYASNAWNARIARSNYEAVALNPLFEKCEPLKREIERLDRRGSGGLSPATSRGISISIAGVEPLFNCANERVTAAERLLRGAGTTTTPSPPSGCPPGFVLSETQKMCVRQ